MAEVLTVVDGVVTVGKCRCGKVLSLTATSQEKKGLPVVVIGCEMLRNREALQSCDQQRVISLEEFETLRQRGELSLP